MRHVKRKKTMKPSSYVLLSELAEASHLFDYASRSGSRADMDEYQRVSQAAEAKLNALALEDPVEATRIYRACPMYFDEYIDVSEVYLGENVFVQREELKTLDTPEKRAAYIKQAYQESAADKENENHSNQEEKAEDEQTYNGNP